MAAIAAIAIEFANHSSFGVALSPIEAIALDTSFVIIAFVFGLVCMGYGDK